MQCWFLLVGSVTLSQLEIEYFSKNAVSSALRLLNTLQLSIHQSVSFTSLTTQSKHNSKFILTSHQFSY